MNYGQIRTRFKALLNRSDCTDDLADTFISQGITRLQRYLRTPAQEKDIQTTVNGTFTGVPVPNDLVELISQHVDNKLVQFVPSSRFRDLTGSVQGTPLYWTRIGSTYKFWPTPGVGSVITTAYYGEFTEFLSDASETTLSNVAVDVVVYGGLTFAADYFIDERKDAFEARFMQGIGELQEMASGADGFGAILPAYDFED